MEVTVLFGTTFLHINSPQVKAIYLALEENKTLNNEHMLITYTLLIQQLLIHY